MRSHSQICLICALLLALLGNKAQSQVTVEDFKADPSGFDLPWTEPVTTVGSGLTIFTSNGEIGKLRNTGDPSPAAGVTQFVNEVDWDRSVQRYLQILVPNLGYGYRSKVSVFSDANPGAELFPHSFYFEIPGQGPRPQTMDLNAVLPEVATQKIIVRLDIINEGYGPNGLTEMNIDWIKIGMGVNDAPTTQPIFLGPTDGSQTPNPPTFQWAAPPGYAGSTYTVSYSQDPLFSDDTTVTVLDSVNGTSYTPPGPLALGTWYWTVSATSANQMSGPFMEKGVVPDTDVRDPRNHQFYSVVVTSSEITGARQWTLY